MRASTATQETSDVGLPEPRPIAVVGMAGRFPGAGDTDELWELLCQGGDAIREVPAERHHLRALSTRASGQWGGFLDHIDVFDAEYFGISPREAERMDPQQRLLLETAQEALDDAGLPADRVAGSTTGTFIGQLGSDYWHMLHRSSSALDIHGMTGSASRAVTSGRLAHAFDLRGPSLTVDTAASSSLTAIHLALQSLWSGECTTAIAGGVNLVLLPQDTMIFSEAGMLAADGRCKFGDASADGFVRSDGVGVVILKPLERALADGDRIRAVVLGSAAGNDGQTSGYLVTPGVMGQQRILERAYRHAGVDPAEIDYVEAHGTGTGVGDPVELQALVSVLGPGRPADRPCLVGSVKSNIGHAEAAAGVAGFIKAVLCLEHGQVPASLHVQKPNPAITWDRGPLRIPRETVPLAPQGRRALAGVSSFGFSGTNVHVVLGAADHDRTSPPAPEQGNRTELLVLSAPSPEALTDLTGSWTRYLAPEGKGRAYPWRDITHSTAVRRQHHSSRLVIPAASHDQALAALRQFLDGEHPPCASLAESVPRPAPRVAFVYPGQGGQWIGMGRQLLSTEPLFAEAIDACDAAVRKEAGWSVTDLLLDGAEERFAKLDTIQPALWAMEVGLTALWRSWGVEPDVVIGHSMGEAAAAYAAGALDLADSAAVICRRSRLAGRLSGQGTMAWVRLGADEAAQTLEGHEERVWVAARNGPASTLLSGEREALAEVLESLDRRGVPNRWVNVDFASHCPHMDAIRDELADALKDIRPRAGTVPVHSTLLGEAIDGSGMDASYWTRNIREPVDFTGAVRGELERDDTIFVEISPHPVLVHSVREIAGSLGREATAVPSLRRDEDERLALLTSLGELSTHGISANWPNVSGDGRFVPLPTTPWQRSSHWLEDQRSQEAGPRPGSASWPDPERAVSTTDSAAAGAWLVLADSGAVGRRLVQGLRDRGHRVIVATVATTLKQTGGDRYRMNPDRRDDFHVLLDEISQQGPCLGIVHLWGLDAVLPDDATAKETERALALGLRSVAHLVDALRHVPFPAPPRIWLFDREHGPAGIDDLLDELHGTATPPPPRSLPTGGVHSAIGPSPSSGTEPAAAPQDPVDASGSAGPGRGDPVERVLTEQVGEVLGIRGRRISADQPLKRMGLDSLMSVELRHRLEKRLRVSISLSGPLGDHTLNDIAEDIRASRSLTSGTRH